MTYDKVDNLIKETDSLGRVTSYEYDLLHNMTKSVDAEGGVSVYSYDAYGNLTSEANPLGRTTTYTYDLCDRMTEMYDPLQQVTSISYDGNYNQTSVTDPMGYATGYIYDKRNQLTSEVDALSNANRYAYDAVGQLVSYTDRRGNSERYTYDAHGNQLSYKDMAGKVTQYSYDLNNNLTKVEDANGGKTYYGYDSMNRMTSYTNALGETTQYTYDYMGNQTSIINADGRVETNIYDEAGRLVQYVKNSKKSIKYDYDALNDLVEKSYYNSTGKESEDAVIYGYNANGERVSMMDLTGKSTYEYDALGRIVKVRNGAGKTVTYKYDEADNLIELGYPDGTSVLYTYDLNNNITSVTEPDGDQTVYQYDALNRVTATIRPDRTATYMTYDEESNLTVLKNVCTHCDEILSEYHYTYNEMGYVVTEEVTERVSVYCGKYHGDKEHGNFWRGKGHEYCQHEWFQYDDKGIEERLEAVNALVKESSPVAAAVDEAGSYGLFRRWGRWFKHPAYLYCTCHTKLVTTSKSYVYDDNWQILSCTTEAADHQITKECYTYDEAGNRTSYERWNGHSKVESIRYEYNSSNQLTATYEQDGWDLFGVEKKLYTYDADGNLVKEEIECRKYHDKDWDDDDQHDGWFDDWWDDWFDDDWFDGWLGGFHGLSVAEETEEPETTNGTALSEFGLANQNQDKGRPTYDTTYTTTTYAYDTENRLKAVREQGILLQAMTYDGDGNLAYELDYNVDAVVDGRCIYLPAHGTKAERDLYKQVCDNRGWVRGDYTLTEYLNDVTRENVEVLAEYGRNYCSVTVYTYGNERIAATTFNGYGYHFGCHDNGYHNIFKQYEKWHDRWQIKDRWHNNHGNRPRTAEATYNYSNVDKFKATYGSYSSYHSGKYCGHKWKTAMSKIYYLYDGHGSVERVHGKDGSTFRLEYDTYGNLVAGIVEKWHVWYNDIFAHRTANIYAYSGERYNVISGLQFLRARWYDTDTGRFISEDSYLGTQENPLSRNRYIYTHNNPVNYIDPSGHILLSTGLIIGATIAAGVISGIYSGVKKAQETNDVKKGIVEGVAVGLATATYTGLMLTTPLSVGGILGAGAASGGIYSYAEMGMSTLLGTKEYSAAEWSVKPYADGLKGALGAGFDLITDKWMGKAGGAILGSKPAKAAINFLSDTKLGKYAIGAWNSAAQFLDDMISGAANASQKPGCALLEDTSNGISNPVNEVTENLIDNLDNPQADFYAGEKGIASSLDEYDSSVNNGVTGGTNQAQNPYDILKEHEIPQTLTDAEIEAANQADLQMSISQGGAVPKSNKLALGLSDYLDEFATTNNAHTWKDFSDPTNWKEGVNNALFNSDMQIVVNLDGIDNPMLAAQRAASNTGGATDWELLQIKLTPSAWNRITWYKNGKIVPNPFE